VFGKKDDQIFLLDSGPLFCHYEDEAQLSGECQIAKLTNEKLVNIN